MRMPRVMFALILLISGPMISAKEWEPFLHPLGPHVLVTMITAPLSPSLSTVSFDLPFSVLSPARPWSRAGATFWIFSDSPYLIPRSYFELGFLFDWAFIDTSRHGFTAGLGTAVGIETLKESVSIPLIVKMEYRYALLKWMVLEATAKALVFGQGGGILLQLQALNRPFDLGIILGFGIGYGFLSEWDFNPHGDALQLFLTVGYSWSKSRGTRQ